MIVNNTTKGLIFLDNVRGAQATLLPGHNEIDDATYATLRPSLELQIAEGHLEEVNGSAVLKKDTKGTTASLEGVTPFEKLEAKEARKLVAGTASLETLEKWLEVETRADIRTVIQKKIDEVRNFDPSAEK